MHDRCCTDNEAGAGGPSMGMRDGVARLAPCLRRRRFIPGGVPTSGMTVLEIAVALSLIGIVVLLSVGWVGSLTRRRLQNAAYLVEGDLRLAQQTAIANAGIGPQAEFCLRSDGYDIYTVVYQDPAGRTSPVAGARIKTANVGQEYPSGIQMTPDAAGTAPCTADPTRQAFVFQATGAPMFPDSNDHGITLTLGGQSSYVDIQPATGLATVGGR